METGLLPTGSCYKQSGFWLSNVVAGLDDTYPAEVVISRLVEAGVNPFELDPIGRTPFVHAVLAEEWGFAEILATKADDYGEVDFVCAVMFDYGRSYDEPCDFGRYAK